MVNVKNNKHTPTKLQPEEEIFIIECSKILVKYYNNPIEESLGFGKIQWLNVYIDDRNGNTLSCLFTCTQGFEFLVAMNESLMKFTDIEKHIFENEIPHHIAEGEIDESCY